MRKVKALIVPLIILGLLAIIVLNIKRESNVEGLTLANNNVEPGKVYVEVILWNDGRELEFINTVWTDFERDYRNMPQTKIARKECKDMLDFLNTIPAMKALIETSNKYTPGNIEKDLKTLCPCVMFLFRDESNNKITRTLTGALVIQLFTKDMLESMFRKIYNSPYINGKTVSTI
jgi:hypothetical protein